MELHPNGRIYQFKNNLPDGEYIAFYDKTLCKDTAMIAFLKNGKVEGVLKRWDDESHLLAEVAEYKEGKLHGIRKLFWTSPEGLKLVNIERWENDIHQEDVQMEW